MEIVSESTILGLVVTSDLSWKRNTESIVKKANTRMLILRNLMMFPVPVKDLVLIYCQFIRSILEFNSNVWFSSITKDESDDIERVQKVACKLILGNQYIDYERALKNLSLENLSERRSKLALKFAKGCLKIDQMKTLFRESKPSKYNTRTRNAYDVDFASSSRLYQSTIPTLQRMLNTS